MKKRFIHTLPIAAAAMLVGCGGSSSSDSTPTPKEHSAFTKKATWEVKPALDQTTTLCFDFDNDREISDCSGTEWDLKFVHGAGRSGTPEFYTNGGVSGEGNGAALGSPFDYSWGTLQKFSDGNVDDEGKTIPSPAFMKDAVKNSFTDAIFEYGAGHKMFPTYTVFLVTTDNSQLLPNISAKNTAFAVQVTGYYGGASGATSGHVTLRWVDVTDSQATPQTKEIDATSSSEWVYFDLVHGTTVDSPTDTNWQLAFQRYTMKTNSGISGKGSIGSFKGTTPKSADDAAVLAALQDSSKKWGWVDSGRGASKWSEDDRHSSLNPEYETIKMDMASKPMQMQFDFGFYSYYSGIEGHADHSLGANPERGVMLRSGEGNSYARVHLTKLEYAAPEDIESQRTYTFEFDVTTTR